MSVSGRSRVRASFDALLYRAEQGRWVNFTGGDIRDRECTCKVQLLENETGYVVNCKHDGQVIYQCNVTAAMRVNQMNADFLQVTGGGVTLGMKFRSEADTNNFTALLEQCAVSGHASMPANRGFNAYQQSEFATVAGGNYREGPNMRNEPNYYPREQFDQRQGSYQPQYNDMQQPQRGGAHIPATPTNQGGVQEVQRSSAPNQQSKWVIKSEQDLRRYIDLLGVALTENDTVFAKSVVNLLVEAKKYQQNFAVNFLPDGAITYFKLCVIIEREMFLDDHPITYYLFVTEDFTIKHLQEMIEMKFSLSSSQQHWIIGKQFASKQEATLKSFGIKSKGAEVYLFISKGVAAADDGAENKDQYQQQPVQQYSYDQTPPEQHYNQQPQGQYNTNQSHLYQQQQSYPQSNGFQAQNNYNQFGMQTLPPPEPIHHQYTGNAGPQLSPGARGHPPNNCNNYPPAFAPEVVVKEPEKPVRPPTPPKIGWSCPSCTVINEPYRPGCEVCGTGRPDGYEPPADYKLTKEEERFLQDDQGLEEYEREQKELQEKEARENYEKMMDMANRQLVPNDEEFECPICFLPIKVGEGVKLRECLHHCCKECLRDHILAFHDADVLCPCNEGYDCKGSVTELEMRALLTEEELEKVHNRGLALAEGQSKSFHCKTADCKGWCVYEDDVNDFDCPVCNKRNCLLCKAIHYPEMNCKEYQEDLRIKAANDKAAQETQKMLEDMIKNGEAMYCPNENCGLIVQKKDGCDWIRCSCKTEICWVTKKPRRGPNGCGCNYPRNKCHPNCRNCH